MMTPLEIFLSAALAGAIRGGYKLATGKDLFPANPKGPLYKWFGKGPTHEIDPERFEPPSRDRSLGPLGPKPGQQFLPRWDVSKRKP
jgi:hypothetical protein